MRRIGREVVEHYTPGPEQFGQKRQPRLVETYKGCWVEFDRTDEGAGERSNVATTLVGIWIPQDVTVHDADDYFIWRRYPEERYGAAGRIGRYVTRQGRLRACYIPVEEVV